MHGPSLPERHREAFANGVLVDVPMRCEELAVGRVARHAVQNLRWPETLDEIGQPVDVLLPVPVMAVP